jgi:hypothetical protein
MGEDVKNIEQALDKIDQAAQDSDPVSLGTIVEGVGSRTFGPLLLLAGIVMASPLSGIPGMPTSMSVLVLVIAAQLIIGRKHFWLPNWLLKRSVSRKRLNKAISWLKKPAGFIDRLLRPRLAFLVHPDRHLHHRRDVHRHCGRHALHGSGALFRDGGRSGHLCLRRGPGRSRWRHCAVCLCLDRRHVLFGRVISALIRRRWNPMVGACPIRNRDRDRIGIGIKSNRGIKLN